MGTPTNSKKVLEKTERGTRWGQDRRLEFIDFRLLWEGRINRSDLTGFFRISVPQASLDLARYMEIAPENVEYDRSEKVYVRTDQFAPIMAAPDSSHFLNQLLAVQSGMMSQEMSFLGWYPPFAAVLSPSRKINKSILFRVLQAIRYGRAIEITYQSLNRPNATERTISPHAIAYDGFRWHTRAYCHEHQDFRDFVFARILQITNETPSDSDSAQDSAWHTVLRLTLKPNPDLPIEQRRAIELDYGMVNGKVIVESKQALLFYLLKRLGLEKNKKTSPQTQQIVLANRDEIEPLLEAAS